MTYKADPFTALMTDEKHEALIKVLKAKDKRIEQLEFAPIIKPLVWEETLADRGDGTSEHDGGYESVTPFGVYVIHFDYFKGMWVAYGLDGGSLAAPVDSPSTAKSIAEADYETRIRAALKGNKDVHHGSN